MLLADVAMGSPDPDLIRAAAIVRSLPPSAPCRAVLKGEVLDKGGRVQALVVSREPRWGLVWRADYLRPASRLGARAEAGAIWRFACWTRRSGARVRPYFVVLAPRIGRAPLPRSGDGG